MAEVAQYSEGGIQAYNQTYQFKVVLLGESAVGKSSIIKRLIHDQFVFGEKPTIPVALCTHVHRSKRGDTAKLELWDTAGMERYRSMVAVYYRRARAALVVFDITDKESFSGAKRWVEELKEQLGKENVLILLVGNKHDLDSKRNVNQREAQNYAAENGLEFMETSAKTGHNVYEVFERIAEQLLDRERKPATKEGNTSDTVDLNTTNHNTASCSQPWLWIKNILKGRQPAGQGARQS